MKALLLFLLIVIPNLLYSQTSFNYRYTEVCSGRTNTVKVVLNNKSDFFTVFFFGENKTFSQTQFNNGEYADWMGRVYTKWSKYYPCQEVLSVVQETSKRVADKGSKDVVQPVIVISSDLAFFTPNDIRIGSGWSETDRLSKKSVGGVGTFGTGNVYALGYFRLSPLTSTLNSIENYNLIFADGSLLGNLINGIYFDSKGDAVFLLNSIVFGNMNGFAFQNNGIILGGSYNILRSSTLDLKGIMIVNYTYYEQIFNLKYWIDNSVKVNPNLSFTYKLSPTFGLNITTNITYRLGRNDGLLNIGILSGGRLSF
jgi:hypothetical protein